MTPARRLMLAGAAVIAGGAVIAIGSRLEWATAVLRASPVNAPGLPRIVLSGGVVSLDASDLGAGYLFGLGLLIALVPLGWLVTGPKGRLTLATLAVAIAIGVFVGTMQTRSDASLSAVRAVVSEFRPVHLDGLRVTTGVGIFVTASGAVLAALAVISGAIAGRHAPRLGLPEKPPGSPEGNGKL